MTTITAQLPSGAHYRRTTLWFALAALLAVGAVLGARTISPAGDPVTVDRVNVEPESAPAVVSQPTDAQELQIIKTHQTAITPDATDAQEVQIIKSHQTAITPGATDAQELQIIKTHQTAI